LAGIVALKFNGCAVGLGAGVGLDGVSSPFGPNNLPILIQLLVATII
jgi:hypothetical protein